MAAMIVGMTDIQARCGAAACRCGASLGFLFWDKAHAKHVLTGCTNVHGKEVVHCLRVESLCIEVGKRGGDALEVLFSLFHGGLFAQNKGLGSMSQGIWRCVPRELSVDLTLSCSS